RQLVCPKTDNKSEIDDQTEQCRHVALASPRMTLVPNERGGSRGRVQRVEIAGDLPHDAQNAFDVGRAQTRINGKPQRPFGHFSSGTFRSELLKERQRRAYINVSGFEIDALADRAPARASGVGGIDAVLIENRLNVIDDAWCLNRATVGQPL